MLALGRIGLTSRPVASRLVTKLVPGTRVRLNDGTLGTAYPDICVGRPFDGTYKVCTPNYVTGGTRVDLGMIRGVHFEVA